MRNTGKWRLMEHMSSKDTQKNRERVAVRERGRGGEDDKITLREKKKNTEAGESETNIGKGDMYKKIEKLRNRRKVDSRKKQNIQKNKKNLKVVRKNNKRQQKE